MAPHLLHCFDTFAARGAQARTCTLINRFGDRFRHTIVALDGRIDARERLDPGADVTVEPPPRVTGLQPARLRRLREWLRDRRPDLLLTYQGGALEVALANRVSPLCPHLHHEDGFRPDEARRQQRGRVWLRRFVLPRAAAVVVPSLTLRAVATNVWWLRPERVAHVPNGIDLAPFARPPDPAAIPGLQRPADGTVIGAVGALEPEKNVRRLVRAFAAATACRTGRLVIVGDGPEREAVTTEIHRFGVADRTLLPGHLPEPARYLGLFDAFALTSDTEQMPIGVIEAMAAGLPVAGTDVGDVRIMVAEPNRRYVVPATDETSLAMVLNLFARDPELRRTLGEANRQKAHAAYGLDKMVAAHLQLIERALASGLRERRSRADGYS